MQEWNKLISKKKIALSIILLELLFTAGYGIFCGARYSAQEEIIYTDADMQLLTTDGDISEGNYSDTSYENVKAIVTPAFRSEKGIYYIQAVCVGQGIIKGGLIYDEPRNGKELVDNEEFYVRLDRQNISYRARLKEDSAVRFKIRLTGDAVDGDYMQLLEVRITPSRLSYIYYIFCLIILFVAVDLLAWGYIRYYQTWKQDRKIIFLMLAFTAFIGGLPLYQTGLTPAKDLVFHLQRVEGIYQGLLAGEFPVRIQPGWLEGHGYAASIFYGDIFMYIPAILRMVGFTVEESYKCYLQLINVATVFVAFYAFYKITKDDLAACAGSILYAGNLYRLDCLHQAKLGRCSAMIFYPLVAAGFYLLFTEDIDSREYKKIWKYLTAGFTGLLMTHMLSSLMVAVYAILVCLVMVKRVLRKNSMIELLKAAGVFFLLNLWYLLPFLSYMFSEKLQINSGLSSKIEEGADYFALLEDFTQEGKTIYQMILDENTLGYAMVFVILFYIITIPIQKKDSVLTKRSRWFFGWSVFSIWVCMNSFPAVRLAKISSVIYKYFKMTQYQFRFMSAAVVFVAALGALFVAMRVLGKEGTWIAVGILLCVTLCQDCAYFRTVTPEEIYLDEADLHFHRGKNTDTYSVGNAEYLPVNVERDNLAEVVKAEDGASFEVIDRKYLTFTLKTANMSEEEKSITLPVLYYTGYQAKDLLSGAGLTTYAGENGCVTVSVPAHYSGSFEMRFREAWYWRAAEIISLITLLCCILYDRGILNQLKQRIMPQKAEV